ncbi:hypothetical protein PsorP6_000593 [Peronosclerospora sorghi]|uniref:Uncharacterized protein n=1 Tax=Peronosclerospora sorghi TaxID=230839 RepID=A0ACC0WVT0_9STRA|nr:hypothetical protein PsorP6_000593 [Peronosclerospora sorghi]
MTIWRKTHTRSTFPTDETMGTRDGGCVRVDLTTSSRTMETKGLRERMFPYVCGIEHTLSF